MTCDRQRWIAFASTSPFTEDNLCLYLRNCALANAMQGEIAEREARHLRQQHHKDCTAMQLPRFSGQGETKAAASGKLVFS